MRVDRLCIKETAVKALLLRLPSQASSTLWLRAIRNISKQKTNRVN